MGRVPVFQVDRSNLAPAVSAIGVLSQYPGWRQRKRPRCLMCCQCVLYSGVSWHPVIECPSWWHSILGQMFGFVELELADLGRACTQNHVAPCSRPELVTSVSQAPDFKVTRACNQSSQNTAFVLNRLCPHQTPHLKCSFFMEAFPWPPVKPTSPVVLSSISYHNSYWKNSLYNYWFNISHLSQADSSTEDAVPAGFINI